MTPFLNVPLLHKIGPVNGQLDRELHTILKLRNLEIGEHSSFFNIYF